MSNDIARIVNKITRQAGDQIKTKELEILNDKKNQAEVALQIIDDNIADLTLKIDKLKKKLGKTRSEYSAKGGDIIAQRQELFNQRNLHTLKVEQLIYISLKWRLIAKIK